MSALRISAKGVSFRITRCTCGRHEYDRSLDGWLLRGRGGRRLRLTARPACVRTDVYPFQRGQEELWWLGAMTP